MEKYPLIVSDRVLAAIAILVQYCIVQYLVFVL